jgi:hypothetical protein
MTSSRRTLGHYFERSGNSLPKDIKTDFSVGRNDTRKKTVFFKC